LRTNAILAWTSLSALSTRFLLFFFDVTAPTAIYTLSLHDALPISLVFGGQSRTFLSPGVHELILVPSDTSHSLIVDFSAQDGVNYTAFAIDSVAGATHTVEPVIVPDTGSVPARSEERRVGKGGRPR